MPPSPPTPAPRTATATAATCSKRRDRHTQQWKLNSWREGLGFSGDRDEGLSGDQDEDEDDGLSTVATSLNSNECFLLQSTSMFIWHGIQSTYEQQHLAAKIAEFLKPRASGKETKEGAEISAFWSALGGKENFTSKKATVEVVVHDPHMFTYSINEGRSLIRTVLWIFGYGSLVWNMREACF